MKEVKKCKQPASPGKELPLSSTTCGSTTCVYHLNSPVECHAAEIITPLDCGFKQIVPQQTGKWECPTSTSCNSTNRSNWTGFSGSVTSTSSS